MRRTRFLTSQQKLILGEHIVRPHGTFDWKYVTKIVNAAKPLLDWERKEIGHLLRYSHKRLHPYRDPLALDLVLHRWLKGGREEAYSDWLQWLLLRLRKPELVFRLLGIRSYSSRWKRYTSVNVRREQSLFPTDGETKRRRTDLDIYVGDNLAILVEVKTDINSINRQQLRDLEKRRVPYRVLLIPPGDLPCKTMFQIRRWHDLCLELRMVMATPDCKSMAEAPLIIAFVGAVEQNVLGFSGALFDRISRRLPIESQLVEYLREWAGMEGFS